MKSNRRLLLALAAALSATTVMPAAGIATANASAQSPGIEEMVKSTSLSGSFLAAQIAARDNDDVAAVAFYERSLELDPDNVELKRLYFLSLTANGRIGDAVKVAKGIPASDEQAPVVRLVTAVDAIKRKDWKGAQEQFKSVSTGDLDIMVEQLSLAWAAFGEGDHKRAMKIAGDINGPDWVQVIRNYHSGLLAALAGDDKTAIAPLTSAIENEDAAAVLSETYMRAMETLIGAHARLGEFDKARQVLDRGLEMLPNYAPFAELTALVDAKKPVPLLIETPSLGAAEVYYNVGTAISRQGGTTFAQGYLQLADYIDNGNDVVTMALAGIFEAQKRHERANEYYARIGKDSPFHRRAELEYALNLNDLEKVDEAKAKLRALVEEEPDDLLAYSTLGGVLSQHDEFAEAAKVYDAAVATIDKPLPQHWNLYYRRGIAYERIKQWDKAEPNFKKALELSPNQADVLNYLGYSWIDQGINLDEGLALIRQAVDLSPRKGYIIDSLGWAYYKLGRYEEAVKELERAVEILPQDPVLNDHLGDAYWKAGRKLEATFQWNHALASKPEPADEAWIRQKLDKGWFEKPSAPTAAAQ
ncbi:MAG TPA: tetratricopeptide repeat protein [Rhizobiaceae bacterium]|nr:tetratricopeptide repeat protein [Rhizobiaceae bacterium]